MKVLITGAKGMLGRTMLRRWGHRQCVGVDVGECNICDPTAVEKLIAAEKPSVVVHCAAMTAVDDCETKQDLAYAVNGLGSANLAGACGRHGVRMIAISTDYVFPGTLDRPYHEWDQTGPTNVYGWSKLAGEEAVRRHCPNHLIARIAWLYGAGGPSFVHTMLRLGKQGGAAMKVVNDQIGNPTSTDAVAERIDQLLDVPLTGTVHLTCEEETTWYGFTKAIFEAAKITREVNPCSSAEYPRPATRPANSRLEKRVLRLAGLAPMPTWQESLGRFMSEFPNG